MSRWMQATVENVPEEFFRVIAEKATSGSAAAHQQAARTAQDDPTYRHRLGTTRYHERNKMLRESAQETAGLRLLHGEYKSHAFPLAACPPYLISHAKTEGWGDPLEPKEHKLHLAERNPGPARQLSLFPSECEGGEVLAMIVIQYPPPGTDQSVPLRVGFGVPNRDLSGWDWLVSLEDLFAAYRSVKRGLSDRARPKLKRKRRSDTGDSNNGTITVPGTSARSDDVGR